MDQETELKVHAIVGLFTLSCFAVSFLYGLNVLVTWAIGLFVLAALINAFCRSSGP
jgi:hypothetical protein